MPFHGFLRLEECVKTSIDATKCTGHGLCYEYAPSVFEPDELGLSVLIGDGGVASDDEEQAQMAEASCPERAITLS